MKAFERNKIKTNILNKVSNNELVFIKKYLECPPEGKFFLNDLIKQEPKFFDWGYCLDFEKTYLEHLVMGLNQCDVKYEGEERDIERIRTCIKLIDIIAERNSAIKYGYKTRSFYIAKYVNCRNVNRFFPSNHIHSKEVIVDFLYREKAWYLYNKIRFEFFRQWWI